MKRVAGVSVWAVLLACLGCGGQAKRETPATGLATAQFAKDDGGEGVGKAARGGPDEEELPPSVASETASGGDDEAVGQAGHHKKKGFEMSVGTTVTGTCPRCDGKCQYDLKLSTSGEASARFSCPGCRAILAVAYKNKHVEIWMVMDITCPYPNCKKVSTYKIGLQLAKNGGEATANCLSCKQALRFGVSRP